MLLILCGGLKNEAKNIRKPDEILKAIDKIAETEIAGWCKAQGMHYPPDAALLRIFKKEKELEIWAKNDTMKTMKLVKVLSICAMDFEPGPKLKVMDAKTPEGFYHPEFGYESTNWWMWIDLNTINEQGQTGKGSCFKMCIEYPNKLDILRTREAGFSKPGSSICIHGNCVSIGCASLVNKDFMAVFAFSRHHNPAKYGKLQVHIFPFRFDKVTDWAVEAKRFIHIKQFPEENLLRFWTNLKEGFDLFNQIQNPLDITSGKVLIKSNGKTIKIHKYLFHPH